MNYLKRNIIFFLVFVILFFIFSIPLITTYVNDYNILDSLYVEKVNQSYQSSSLVSQLSVEDKLQLLSDYQNKSRKIVVLNHVQDMNSQNIKNIRQIIQEQLAILSQLKLIPEFQFDNTYICQNFVLKSYRDIVKENECVNIFQLSFLSGEKGFSIWIDVDTQKIYQYRWIDKTQSIKNDFSVLTFGIKYLGLDQKNANKYLDLFNYGKNTNGIGYYIDY